jgi:hypothetical protein
VQVAILSGIVSRATPDLVRSHPTNVMPVVESGDGGGTGISKGYLRTPPGVRTVAAITGPDRGGTDWNGAHYRVIGASLVTVANDGATTTIGAILNDGKPVTFATSFDRLAIAGSGNLYYYDGTALVQVTDPDLGAALSVVWQDGYFLTTDGTSIVATELNDPTAVDPLKYGSSEADPDPVVGLLSQRSRLYGINRYSIEVFNNVGGTGFPFAVSRGSQIPKGAVGPHAYSPFVETFAFVGSGRNEAPAVYLAGSGQGIGISPRALNIELEALNADQLAAIEVETRNVGGLVELLVHLPNVTWAYGWTSSQQADLPVWYRLAAQNGPYVPRHLTLSGGLWWVGSATALGVIDDTISAVFGEDLAWSFDTPLTYNAGNGAIFHAVELVTIGGRSEEGDTVALSWTDDGVTYGGERFTSTGIAGQRAVRPAWRRLGRMRSWRGLRFRGVARSPVAFARLEATLEGLNG